MRYLLAFDPGPSTGIAQWEWRANGGLRPRMPVAYTVRADGRDPTPLYRTVQQALDDAALYSHGDAVVVCESFRTLAPAASVTVGGQITAHLCGWIEGLALTHGLTFLWQQPAVKRAYVTDARRLPHDSVHALDALCHGLAYLARQDAPRERLARRG